MTQKEIEIAELKFKIGITKISKSYIVKCLEIQNYRLYNEYTNLIINKANVEHIKLAIAAANHEQVTYPSFLSVVNEMDNQTRSYNSINDELVYKIHFQFFEEFLSETIYFCLETFPKYMSSHDQKNELPYDKIFGNDCSIGEIRDFVITSRVKNIIQSNNIIDIISKIERLFSIKFKLEKSILDVLFVASLNRNILTHNSGIVNEVYINQLKYRSLSTKLLKGNNILNHIDIDVDRSNQDMVVDQIEKIFHENAKRLVVHHSKLI